LCPLRELYAIMDSMEKLTKIIFSYIQSVTEDHVSAYAAQAAYFIILSAPPFAIFLLMLLQASPLTYNDLLSILQSLNGETLDADILYSILDEVYTRAGLATASITILVLLWSSGKAIFSITNGIHEIYGMRETRNYVFMRFVAAVYTLLLAIALIGTLGILVFGRQLYSAVTAMLPGYHDIFLLVMSTRMLIIFAILLVLFIFIFKVLPNEKIALRSVLPGAVGCSLAWMLTSYGFSAYFSRAHNFSYMYGSLAGIMAIMLWLYLCMYELFLFAEVNYFLTKSKRYRASKKKREREERIRKRLDAENERLARQADYNPYDEILADLEGYSGADTGENN